MKCHFQTMQQLSEMEHVSANNNNIPAHRGVRARPSVDGELLPVLVDRTADIDGLPSLLRPHTQDSFASTLTELKPVHGPAVVGSGSYTTKDVAYLPLPASVYAPPYDCK